MNVARMTLVASVGAAALSVGLAPAAARAAAGPVPQPKTMWPQAKAAPQAETWAVAVTCAKEKVRWPRTFVLACGDGTESLDGLTWTTWQPGQASGSGTDSINDCTPTCAQGKYHDYPVLVDFTGSAAVYGHPGLRRYTSYTLVYTGKRPPEQKGPARTGQLWP